MNLETWLALFGHFFLLSFLAIGGAIAVVPDMHRYLVGTTGLLTDSQFNASIAIAQASPGPNVLFVAVMGWQAAGWVGTAASLLGIMLPSTVLTIGVARWAQTRSDWLPLRAFRAGMAPITIGLLGATGWILAGDAPSWRLATVTVCAALLVWRTRVHLLWLIAAGGALGAFGLI